MAKQGNERQPHFAHIGETGLRNQHSCHGYYEAMMHRLAKQIISDEKSLMLPSYKEVIPSQQVSFVDVEVEERNDSKDIQPDIVGITADGRRIHVEICYSHKVPETKKQKLRKLEIECLEIYIKDWQSELKTQDRPYENIKEEDIMRFFLLQESSKREWLNYPEGERLFKENWKRELEKRLERERQSKEEEKTRKQEEEKLQELIDKERKRKALEERKLAIEKQQKEERELKERIEQERKRYLKDYEEWEQAKAQNKDNSLEKNGFYQYKIGKEISSLSDLFVALKEIRNNLSPFIPVAGHDTKIIWVEMSKYYSFIYILHANVGCQGLYPFHLTRAMIVDGKDCYQNLGVFREEHHAMMSYLREKEK